MPQVGGAELERAIQHGPQRLNDCPGWQTVQTELPWQRGRHDTGPLAARPPRPRVGGSEQRQGAGANGSREMGDTRIVPRKEVALCQYRCQSRQGHVSQHLPRRAEGAEQRGEGARFLSRPAYQDAG